MHNLVWILRVKLHKGEGGFPWLASLVLQKPIEPADCVVPDALQAAGFPIYTEKVEGKSLWSLLDTVKHQIPIPFSPTELMALYFSRDMLKVFKGTVFHNSLESLFQKVKTTLPSW